MYIYKVTNNVTGKIYIGQTIRKPAHRWKSHGRKWDKGYLANSIRKYGKENFTFEVIACAFTRDYLNELECFFIKKFNCLAPKGYNLESGGNANKTITQELRDKFSRVHKGRIPYNKGIPCSQETKDKLSKANTGKKHSEESKRRRSLNTKGRKHSEKTKQLMSYKARNRGFIPRRGAVKATHLVTGEVRLFTSITEACVKKEFDISGICKVLKGKRASHKNYRWEEC